MIELHETVHMNQISPKVFEAISLKTALILFEGNYSSVLTPDVHYISLKKDFSNIAEVMEKLQDDAYIETLTEKAYQDIIETGKYSYHQFVEQFDQHLLSRVKKNSYRKEVLISHAGYLKKGEVFLSNIYQEDSFPLNKVLGLSQINSIQERRNQIRTLNNSGLSYPAEMQKVLEKSNKSLKILRFVQKNCPVFIKRTVWKCMPGSIERRAKTFVNGVDESCVG
jgi:hypothetical protein